MYYEDYEPIQQGGFDTALNRVIEKEVRKRCKRLYKEYDSVKAENKKLQEVKENFEEIKNEYEYKINELERAKESIKKEIERDFLKLKYTDVINKFGETLYSVNRKGFLKDKCSFCDKDRKYILNTPDGKTHKVDCSCSGYIYKYVVVEESILRITLVKEEGRNLKLEMHYQDKNDRATSGDGTYVYEVYGTFKESNDTYRAYYKSKEEAQKHCDYLNNKEGK